MGYSISKLIKGGVTATLTKKRKAKMNNNIKTQNSSLRDFIKRFNRKTKAYSRSAEMAELAVYIHFFYESTMIS